MCEFCESPREWSNMGTFYTWTRNYHSPDKNPFATVFDFFMDYIPKGSKYYDEGMDIFPSREYHKRMETYLDKAGLIWLPVYKYEHGTISYSTGSYYNKPLPQGHARFDSGQCGYIFVEKSKVYKEYNVKKISSKLKQKVLDILVIEVEEYSNWANGLICYYDEMA